MYKRNNGLFYTNFKGRDGKQVRLSCGTGNEREATRKAKELEEAYWKGTIKGIHSNNGLTLEAAFSKAFRTSWRTLRCYKTYEADSATCLSLLGKDILLSDISSKVVSDLKAKLYAKGYAIATVNNKLACLSSLLRVAMDEWEEIGVRPKFVMDDPRNKRMRLISRAEEIEALGHSDPELADLLIVLMDTGIRLGEALKLKPNDIQRDVRTLRIVDPKVIDGDRGVPMSKRVISVFDRRNGFESTKDSIEKRWVKVREAMDLKDDPEFVLHTYRHTCATRLLSAGVSIYTVQKWLGHKSIETTMRYAKMTTNQFDVARDILDSGNDLPELRVIKG